MPCSDNRQNRLEELGRRRGDGYRKLRVRHSSNKDFQHCPGTCLPLQCKLRGLRDFYDSSPCTIQLVASNLQSYSMRTWRSYRLDFELVLFKLSSVVRDLPVSLYAVIPYVSV